MELWPRLAAVGGTVFGCYWAEKPGRLTRRKGNKPAYPVWVQPGLAKGFPFDPRKLRKA